MRINHSDMSAGTYLIKCGNHVYAGSSVNFKARKADHFWRLKNGTHPNNAIQDAYNTHGAAEFQSILMMNRAHDDTDTSFRDKLRAEEQSLINDLAKNDLGLIPCNKSSNSRGPCSRPDVKAKWLDPDYRAVTISRLRSFKHNDEARAKMSEAKKGGNHPKARSVIVTNPDGTEREFPCVSDAAKFFRVSQQMVDKWLKGVNPWPGRGEYTRFKNEWISKYSARFKVG